MNAARQTEHVELIKLPEVRRISGLGTTTIYKMANEGLFPRQIKLGCRSVAWVRQEVEKWAAEQVAAARGEGFTSQS